MTEEHRRRTKGDNVMHDGNNNGAANTGEEAHQH